MTHFLHGDLDQECSKLWIQKFHVNLEPHNGSRSVITYQENCTNSMNKGIRFSFGLIVSLFMLLGRLVHVGGAGFHCVVKARITNVA